MIKTNKAANRVDTSFSGLDSRQGFGDGHVSTLRLGLMGFVVGTTESASFMISSKRVGSIWVLKGPISYSFCEDALHRIHYCR